MTFEKRGVDSSYLTMVSERHLIRVHRDVWNTTTAWVSVDLTRMTRGWIWWHLHRARHGRGQMHPTRHQTGNSFLESADNRHSANVNRPATTGMIALHRTLHGHYGFFWRIHLSASSWLTRFGVIKSESLEIVAPCATGEENESINFWT